MKYEEVRAAVTRVAIDLQVRGAETSQINKALEEVRQRVAQQEPASEGSFSKKFRFTNGNELHVITTEGGGLRLDFLRYRPDSTFSHLSPGIALGVAAALVAGVEEIKRRPDTCQGCLERLHGHTIGCPTWKKETPCLEPEKMNGFCDQFPGSDYYGE